MTQKELQAFQQLNYLLISLSKTPLFKTLAASKPRLVPNNRIRLEIAIKLHGKFIPA
jgi:hypothetical protein